MTGLLYPTGATRWSGEADSYESSPGILRIFCRTCGSPLGFRQARVSATEFLLLGTFDDPALIEVRDNVDHVFAERELAWMKVDDHFPHAEGMPESLAGGD